MSGYHIHVQDLTMRFGERPLFNAPALDFKQGDVIYLEGDNGTGKTTLMKVLAGLVKPSSGTVTAANRQRSFSQPNPLLGYALYLHQHPYLFDGDVSYNLKLAQRYSKLPKAEQLQRLDAAIELSQLGHLLKSGAANLSGGERQRLALARTWLLKPQLLMLDEPISNMDRVSQQLVFAMIGELKKQGTGLLLSSHQDSALFGLCQQRWLIESQQIRVSEIRQPLAAGE
ncbi:energy-coupling factor ABC transporter ATP-binding protein [Shewanella avicenniae]|uniref:Energy-coupling factor ABC transporter ATP-binding protein n=1 Tax=Shewanella avicenniae TaxID=2814294 RepID=A0ABX7QRS4_9GAMM|nr:energy-coupling factor ABC transporter ATP-binding protein [Shewanella avicenniae]QSX33583.1 energy-coupling factor ABC transporter ATP-binding protein [Shewanella avicenniae]